MKKIQLLVRDEVFFWKAVDIAYNGQHRVRVGCVAAVNGKLICGGFNTYRNDPKITPFGNSTYHAEKIVLQSIPNRFLRKTTLYIARLNQKGDACPSKPCSVCLTAIDVWRVNEIVYMNDIGTIVKEKI